VCKGYQRPYITNLARLVRPLSLRSFDSWSRRYRRRQRQGSWLWQAFCLYLGGKYIASSLNASMVFKIFPTINMSLATMMMDMIAQIGNGNVVDTKNHATFKKKLRTEIINTYTRSYTGHLALREGVEVLLG